MNMERNNRWMRRLLGGVAALGLLSSISVFGIRVTDFHDLPTDGIWGLRSVFQVQNNATVDNPSGTPINDLFTGGPMGKLNYIPGARQSGVVVKVSYSGGPAVVYWGPTYSA